ncbi:hypothetical protein ABW20_dc0110317 [Dactylellina cionopaga]|nr:hypothetical protein ABW20_dc0110317 [Dactylellina cionopaga]
MPALYNDHYDSSAANDHDYNLCYYQHMYSVSMSRGPDFDENVCDLQLQVINDYHTYTLIIQGNDRLHPSEYLPYVSL